MEKNYFTVAILFSLLITACGSEVAISSNDISSENISSESISLVSSEVSSESSSSILSSSSQETTIAVESVSLNKTSFEIYVGDTPVTLTARITPSKATNKDVIWFSSDDKVAEVDDYGKVTPLKEGTAVIMVVISDGKKSASCTVTVKEHPSADNYVIYGLFAGKSEYTSKEMLINSYKLSECMLREVTLYEGDTFKIHMYGNDWYGASKLKSSVKSGLVKKANDDYIEVTATGLYDIYCDSNYSDGGHIYLDKVGVIQTVAVEKVVLDRTGVYMVQGSTYKMNYSIYPRDAANKEVTWSSSKEEVATVSQTGIISGLSKGKTTITATSKDGNKEAKCTVFVNDKEEPDFYLVGTIQHQSYWIGDYGYAAYPDTGDKYIIPDVVLYEDDELYVYNPATGKVLKDSMGRDYVVKIDHYMSVNIYLNILSATKNYLELDDKNTRRIHISYSDYINNNNLCAWIYVSGDDIESEWIRSSDLSSGSTGSDFIIPRNATSFIFVRGYRTANPDSTYKSIGTTYKESGPHDILVDVSDYYIK